MVGDLILLDRSERTQADMQRHERQFYSLGFQRVKQLGREVQAGGDTTATKQSPEAGTKVSLGAVVTVEFSDTTTVNDR